MKKVYLQAFLAVVVLLQAGEAWAQQWRLSFSARCLTTNNNGNFVVRSITDRTLVRRCLEQSGISVTNGRQYTLVYNRGADLNGDVIQVVNVTNGAVVCTPYKVLFQQGIPNSSGRIVEGLGFLYPGAGGDAVGSVRLRTHAFTSGRVVITAKLQYLDNHAGGLAVCSGSFHTIRTFSP